jgi:hypothetical protein
MTSLLSRSRDRSPSRVSQVFTAVAWQQEVRRYDANSDSFTLRLSSALVGNPRHGTENTPLRLRLRNRGACFDVTILVWRKYATVFSPVEWLWVSQEGLSVFISKTNLSLVYSENDIKPLVRLCGARGSVFGWGTMLQAERSRVRFPMTLLDFSIYLILPAAL